MGRYKRLGNMNGGKLGSFEGHGVSNTFGGQFGDAVSDLPRNQQYLSQVEADFQLSQRTMSTNIPQSWQYWEFQGKLPSEVANTAPRKIGDLKQKIAAGQGGGSTASSGGSDTSASDILTGFAAILNPLAQLGVGIYTTNQRAEMERAAVVVVMIMMGMMMMMMKKNKEVA
jgi:hypothetical protein